MTVPYRFFPGRVFGHHSDGEIDLGKPFAFLWDHIYPVEFLFDHSSVNVH
jgi:hypothetical protein